MELKVISDILAQADNVVIAEVQEPGEEVRKGEKEAGILPEHLIKLYGYFAGLRDKITSVSKQAAKESTLGLIERLFGEKDGGFKDLLSGLKAKTVELYPLEAVCSLAKDMFWAEVNREFGLEKVGSIGLRKGWKVVELSDDPLEDCSICDKREDCPLIAVR